MLRVGLTGGIGSGKSSVARRLAELGARVTDADLVAREVVEPGTAGLAAIRDRFGGAVIQDDGSLDRGALAAIVFTDRSALAELEAITGPAIAGRVGALRRGVPPGAIDVFDMPLMVEQGGWVDEHVCLVVDAPVETRVGRLVGSRGLPEADARARIAAQAGDEQRRAAADVWLDNSGNPADLTAAVDALWVDRLAPWNENLLTGRAVRRATRIVLDEPDPAWAERGRRAVARLRHQLARAGLLDRVGTIEHIGSTSVPGLIAKPVIDLQVTMTSFDELIEPDFVAALRRAGFVPGTSDGGDVYDDVYPEIDSDPTAWRKTYWHGTDPAIVYHLHCRIAGGPGERLSLAFRDYLRAHPDQAGDYAVAKRAAAAAAPGLTEQDRGGYLAAKGPWVTAAVRRALVWQATRL